MILLSSLLRVVLFGAAGLLDAGRACSHRAGARCRRSLLGVWLGNRLHAAVPAAAVVKAVYALLVIAGLTLLARSPLIALAPRQWLLLALAATLLFRFWLAAAAPVTADEAYFILWGRAPALGYYDHPPMVGWMLAPLAALSEAPWLLRLPAVLVPPLAALMVRARAARAGSARDEDTADLAALAVLLLPINVWNVLDHHRHAARAVLAWRRCWCSRAPRRRIPAGLFLASGVLLGLAFLSKYFAVLLGLAYLVWAISCEKSRPFLLVFLGGLPFGLLNLYWNYEACWCNVMFNAINRHDGRATAAGRWRRRRSMRPRLPTWPRRCSGSRGAGVRACARPGSGRPSARCCSPGWCRSRCSPRSAR